MSTDKPKGERLDLSEAELNELAHQDMDAGLHLLFESLKELSKVQAPLNREQLKALFRLEAAKRGMIERDLPLREYESLAPAFLCAEAVFSLMILDPDMEPVRLDAEIDLAMNKAILAVAKWRHEKCINSPEQLLVAFNFVLSNPSIPGSIYDRVYLRGSMMLSLHGIAIEEYIAPLDPLLP